MRAIFPALLLAAGLAASPAARADAGDCDAAAAAAELRHGVPTGLLAAIGRIESGRRDPATNRVSAWPWTINAAGRGQVFATRAEAETATRALRSGGTASIDVGCFQVNLLHHPAAFAAPEDGFDPERNADYAASFLKSLQQRSGNWGDAVGAYHSLTPERGGPYRERVMAAWGGIAPAPVSPAPAVPPLPMVRSVSWSATAGGMRVWTPSAPGQGAAVIALSVPGR